MRSIVGSHLEAPQILLHGLLAARLVFLGFEGNLILSDLGEILCTGRYCGRNGCEAVTDVTLVSGDRRRTLVSVFVLEVDTRVFGLVVAASRCVPTTYPPQECPSLFLGFIAAPLT